MLAAHSNDAVSVAALTGELLLIDRIVKSSAEVEQNRRDVLAINAAWRGGSISHGLEKLVTLRDLLVAEACEAAHGLTVAEQLDQLRTWRAMPAVTEREREARLEALSAMTWRCATWATSLRRAFLAQLVRKIPLRQKALRHLKVGMIAVPGTRDTAVRPWDVGTTVLVTVPGTFTKNGEPYRVAYVSKDGAGQPAQEEGAARWLLELYLAEGGGRDWFVAAAPAGTDTSAAFPLNARRGNNGHGVRRARTSLTFADEGLSSEWRVMVLQFASALGIDLDALRAIQGGLGLHSIRYLFGRYWAHVRQQLEFASDMLHHGDIKITKEKYVGTDPTAKSHDVMEHAPPAVQTGGDAACQLVRLEEENAALRRALALR